MGKIYVNDIRCYAFHGCLVEETKIGTCYRIDVIVTTCLEASAQTDALEDTVDYVSITAAVLNTMKKPCKLIETVLYKIHDQLFRSHPTISALDVHIHKLNPPINANVYSVGVRLKQKRKNWVPKGNV
ncbi:MAG: dihydroneopterin aldolase [Flavobacteriaceae bacterium TMED120]|nr:MAG: dihydroneopterin aldolase [Flavobacteriaceae bacterium TMED120]CAI8223036.1 MAG: Dihydroneopterin aldolase [Flavobacteriaceae bacterium]HCQ23940.1 dihydroneopterin aldolase [Flavobacteriaceae bacterium]|tara:strand:- start:57 stop:440 length:384 start_codon:yes stop_codon:yes gene_type:complete